MTPPRRSPDGQAQETPSPPPAISSLLPFVLFGVGRLMERELEVRLAERGLSLRTVGVLGHLTAMGHPSYSDLARRADVTVQTMHATVRRMIADGLVAAEGVSGKAALLSATAYGRARLEDAARIVLDYENELRADSQIDADATKIDLTTLARSAWRLRSPPSS